MMEAVSSFAHSETASLLQSAYSDYQIEAFAIDMEGYGALQFFTEEKLSRTPLLVRYRKRHGSRLARLLGARDRARLRSSCA